MKINSIELDLQCSIAIHTTISTQLLFGLYQVIQS